MRWRSTAIHQYLVDIYNWSDPCHYIVGMFWLAAIQTFIALLQRRVVGVWKEKGPICPCDSHIGNKGGSIETTQAM
jgi:hypothetical protein